VTRMKFAHVATRTMDLDAAIAFYKALGLELSRTRVMERNKATLAFMTRPGDDFSIELVYNWGKDAPYEGGGRFGHFAFDVDDLEAAYAESIAAGAAEVGRPPAPHPEGTGPRIAFVADPDGNWIELIERG
jgi:lactoylglutathione lyase